MIFSTIFNISPTPFRMRSSERRSIIISGRCCRDTEIKNRRRKKRTLQSEKQSCTFLRSSITTSSIKRKMETRRRALAPGKLNFQGGSTLNSSSILEIYSPSKRIFIRYRGTHSEEARQRAAFLKDVIEN